MRHMTEFKKQKGLAMMVAMLILIALTLIVLSGSRNTTMQLRMSSNLQSHVEAVEHAQAGLDLAETIPAKLIPTSADVLCTENHPGVNNCGPVDIEDMVTMPTAMNYSSGGTSSLVLERDTASKGGACPLEPGKAVSRRTFDCSYFKATSTFDDTGNGQGKATLVTGLIKKTLQ
jgi:Tfp pilus assembly protein PilX